jgi:hypothetical protein
MGKMGWARGYGGFGMNESAEFAEWLTETNCRYYNRHKSTERN